PNGPTVRRYHSAVWTGTGGEMIVWGGYDGTNYLNDGFGFSPTSNNWFSVSASNAPSAPEYHTAVWTGSEMIGWGRANAHSVNDGGRYNPAANSWTPVNTTPAPRYSHTAVWTGSEMIVWGGYNYDSGIFLSDGGRYNPAGNSWTAVITT